MDEVMALERRPCSCQRVTGASVEVKGVLPERTDLRALSSQEEPPPRVCASVLAGLLTCLLLPLLSNSDGRTGG